MKNAPRYLRCGWGESTQAGIRTQDQLVKSHLLYQLSYLRGGFGFAVLLRRDGKVVEG